MKRRIYTALVPCRGGCGKTLTTGTRLGSAANRQKYAGYCDNCMPSDLRKHMEADSLAHLLNRAQSPLHR